MSGLLIKAAAGNTGAAGSEITGASSHRQRFSPDAEREVGSSKPASCVQTELEPNLKQCHIKHMLLQPSRSEPNPLKPQTAFPRSILSMHHQQSFGVMHTLVHVYSVELHGPFQAVAPKRAPSSYPSI